MEGGVSFPLIPLILSPTDYPGLPSLVASRNFNKISSKDGQATFHFFSGLRVRIPAIFSSINPFYTLTKDPLNLVFFEHLSNIQLQIYLSVMTNSFVSTIVASLVTW